MAIGIGLAIAGVLGAGASIFGSVEQSNAASKSAQMQQQMLSSGLGAQQAYLGQAANVLSPYINQGAAPLAWYNYLTGAGPYPGMAGSFGAPAGPGAGSSAGPSGGLLATGTPAGPGSTVSGNLRSWTDPATGQVSWIDALGNPVSGPAGGGAATGGAAPGLTGGPGAPSGAPAAYNPLTAPLTAPFTAGTLSSTPGYQFALSQGLLGVSNENAAMGLTGSGAEAKALTGYASGAAQNVYNAQFQNYLAQNQQIANLLLGSAGIGSAAAGTLAGLYGNAGTAALGGSVNTGAGVGNALTQIGNAQAGGAVGASNSLTNAIIMNSLLNPKTGMGGSQTGLAPASAVPASYVNNEVLAGGTLNPMYGYGTGLGYSY